MYLEVLNFTKVFPTASHCGQINTCGHGAATMCVWIKYWPHGSTCLCDPQMARMAPGMDQQSSAMWKWNWLYNCGRTFVWHVTIQQQSLEQQYQRGTDAEGRQHGLDNWPDVLRDAHCRSDLGTGFGTRCANSHILWIMRKDCLVSRVLKFKVW